MSSSSAVDKVSLVIIKRYASENPQNFTPEDVRRIVRLQRLVRSRRKTRWERLCDVKSQDHISLAELRQIAARQNILDSAKQSRRGLCVELARLSEMKPIGELIFPHGLGYGDQIEQIFRQTVALTQSPESIASLSKRDIMFLYKESKRELLARKSILDAEWDVHFYQSLYAKRKEEEYRNAIDTSRFIILPLTLEFDGLIPLSELDEATARENIEKGYSASHQNVVVIDTLTKVAWRYEPYYFTNLHASEKIHQHVVELMESDYGVRFDDHSALQQESGVQTIYNGELCVLYSAFFVYTFFTKGRTRFDLTVTLIRDYVRDDTYFDRLLVFIRLLVSTLGREFFIPRPWEPAIDMLPTLSCCVCSKPTQSICSHCISEMIPYCSESCQRMDWEKHKGKNSQ